MSHNINQIPNSVVSLCMVTALRLSIGKVNAPFPGEAFRNEFNGSLIGCLWWFGRERFSAAFVSDMIYPHDFEYTSSACRLKRWYASLGKECPSPTNDDNSPNVNAVGKSEKRFRALQLVGLADPDLLNFGVEREPAKDAGRPSIFRMILNQCERYCSNSSIHGVKYLVDARLHWIER